MLNLEAIRNRVHKGIATTQDTHELLAEVEKFYAEQKPEAEEAAPERKRAAK